MIPLKAKDSSVNLDLHEEFAKAAPILRTAWMMYGADVVVASGKDGKHSANSAHYKGLAVDLRINNLPASNGAAFDKHPLGVTNFAWKLAHTLETLLGDNWYVVLEDDHIHLEFAPIGKRPNIKGFQPGKNFYSEAK